MLLWKGRHKCWKRKKKSKVESRDLIIIAICFVIYSYNTHRIWICYIRLSRRVYSHWRSDYCVTNGKVFATKETSYDNSTHVVSYLHFQTINNVCFSKAANLRFKYLFITIAYSVTRTRLIHENFQAFISFGCYLEAVTRKIECFLSKNEMFIKNSK